MSESVSVFSVISAFSHIEIKNAAFAGIQLFHFFIHHIPHSTVNCSLYSRQFQCMNILEIRSSVSITAKTVNHYRTAYKGKTGN